MSDDEIVLSRAFLERVLATVRDLTELKVILRVAQLAAGRRFPGVGREELVRGPVVRTLVGLDSPVPAEERLFAGLERAVSDGLLLRLDSDSTAAPVYVPNTEANARLMREPALDSAFPLDAEVVVHRPNVFALYEQHLGPLNPLLAEQLRDAERMYPRAWIEQAILQAVHYNKRNWRYVESILTRWEETGAPDGIVG